VDSREFTLRALILGILLAVVFGAANAYLGLKAGMTVSASIPAAVVSMAILRGLLRSGTVLENNMVQTIASAGESLAAGVIFTVPALLLLGLNPSLFLIFLVAATGGLLGVLLMVPIRKHLIEDEHNTLPYPEGTACAEVLEAGEEGGKKAREVFLGMGLGALFKALPAGAKLYPGAPSVFLRPLKTLLGVDLSPALIGVGYILGLRISALVLAGGVLGWFVFIPLIAWLKGIPVVNAEAVFDLWHTHIRYIGAGAVLAGGIVSLLRSGPAIAATLRHLRFGHGRRDLPLGVVFTGVALGFLWLWWGPWFGLGLYGALFSVIFAFLFVLVSARIVGIVGSSSNPVSGMTIATLLVTSLIFVKLGAQGTTGMLQVLTLGAVVCIAAAIAGDTAQDLKTGFLVGATPWKQQIGELVGVLTSAVFIGWTLYLLHHAYTIGSRELSAPQATLMSLVVKGVFEGNLPWFLVGTGVFTALSVELLGIHSLPFAVGLYLPLELSTSLVLGGLVAHLTKNSNQGVLFASGLVAGDALTGILIALVLTVGLRLPHGPGHPALAWVALGLLMLLLYLRARSRP